MTGRILIVDDIATNRIVLKVKLSSAHYDTLLAASGAEALRLAEAERPDLILLDMGLLDIGGCEVCERLKSNPATSDIPVIMVTEGQYQERKIAALLAGAAEVFWKPLDDKLLLAKLRSLMRRRDSGDPLALAGAARPVLELAEPAAEFDVPGLTAIVTTRPQRGLALRRQLAPILGPSIAVLDADAALALNDQPVVPEVFLLDIPDDRDETTLRLLSELRSRPASQHSEICVMLSAGAGAAASIAHDLGAGDVVDPAADPQEIALRLSALVRCKRRADRLRRSLADGLRSSVVDPLTGLFNRRYALPQLARAAARSAETGESFAILVLDLDRFKSVNDTFGHAAGDKVLSTVARRLEENLRPSDMAARVGGEEFLILLPDTTLKAARAIAERLRSAVEREPVPLPRQAGVQVTLSIGLAMGGGARIPRSADTLVEAADRALLRAKSRGRNQVTVDRDAA